MKDEMKDKQSEFTDNEFTEPQMVEQALMHLMQSASFLAEAGYKETSTSLMNFAYKALTELSETNEGDLKLVKDKLSNDEYDNILNKILNIDV